MPLLMTKNDLNFKKSFNVKFKERFCLDNDLIKWFRSVKTTRSFTPSELIKFADKD